MPCEDSVTFAYNSSQQHSIALVNIYAVHYFRILPVNVLDKDYSNYVNISISLTCSLRCTITTYCICVIEVGHPVTG